MKTIKVAVLVHLLEDTSNEDDLREISMAVVDGTQHNLIESTELIYFGDAGTTETDTHAFDVLQGDDGEYECTLNVTITDEGVVCDVVDCEGLVYKTWGVTAQDLADGFCK